MKEKKLVARIFEEVTGLFHCCDDSLDYLDARGTGYKTIREACYWARISGYTHYRRGNRTRKL